MEEYKHPELTPSEESAYQLGAEFTSAVKKAVKSDTKFNIAGLGILSGSFAMAFITAAPVILPGLLIASSMFGVSAYNNRKVAVSLRDKFNEAVQNETLDQETQRDLEPLQKKLQNIKDISVSEELKRLGNSYKQNRLLLGFTIAASIVIPALAPYFILGEAQDLSRTDLKNINKATEASIRFMSINHRGRDLPSLGDKDQSKDIKPTIR